MLGDKTVVRVAVHAVCAAGLTTFPAIVCAITPCPTGQVVQYRVVNQVYGPHGGCVTKQIYKDVPSLLAACGGPIPGRPDIDPPGWFIDNSSRGTKSIVAEAADAFDGGPTDVAEVEITCTAVQSRPYKKRTIKRKS